MLNLLYDVFICRGFVDCFVWKVNPYGSFSSKSFLKELQGSSEVRILSLQVWMNLVPPRVEAFCWLAVSRVKFQ